MGIFQQVTNAITRLRNDAPRMMQKAAPYLFNVVKDQPVWHMLNFLSNVLEGFEKNSLIYSAIMYKVRAIGQTRVRAYTGDEDAPTRVNMDHPMAQLLRRPNKHQSWIQFESLLLTYLNLSGNAYIYIDRDNPSDIPNALYPLRPDRVFFIPDEHEIRGFLYTPLGITRENGIPMLAENIMHIKLPNPGDDYEGMGYGMSPVKPAGASGDVDNDITKFLKLFMERGAVPNGILKFNVPLDPKTINDIRARWRERYGGVDNWADVGVLDNGGSYQQIAMNFKDMGFETLDERTESRVLGPLGVPGILLDTRAAMKNSTYSNKQEARRAFWEDTMTYEIGLFDQAYEHHLHIGGIWLQRDYTRVPALQKNIPELVTAAKTLWEMGAPFDYATAAVGLKIDQIPGGDVSYIGTSYLPAGQLPADQPKTITLPARRTSLTMKAMGDDAYCVLAYFKQHNHIQTVQDILKTMLPEGTTYQKSDTFHLTLAYATGTADQAEQVSLSNQLIPIVGDGVDQFDTPDGYAIYLRVRLNAELAAYQAHLVDQMQSAGMEVSPHSLDYKPHITLAFSPDPIQPFDLTPTVITINEVHTTDDDYRTVQQARLKAASGGIIKNSNIRIVGGDSTHTDLFIPHQQKKSRWNEEEKAAIWLKQDSISESWEDRFGDAAAEAFDKDRRAILAIVEEAKEKALRRKATIDWLALSPDITAYLTDSSLQGWRNTFVPSMSGLIRDTGDYWSTELGMAWDVRNLLGEQWFADYTLVFAQPINETSSNVIQGVLAQGQAEGWSIYKMQENLGTLFDQWIQGDLSPEDFEWLEDRMPPYRRELIARTETTRLQAAGSRALYKSWDIEKKEWLATPDDRTRPSHKTANGQIRDMDEPFKVGGFKMQQPGDMTLGAPISEAGNCRCTILPIIEDD